MIDEFHSELMWAAGLFEGEGCFSLTKRGPYSYPRAALAMTDEEPVRRFHRAIGVGEVVKTHSPSARACGNKPQWRWRSQRSDEVVAAIGLLWPELGERRRKRASEILAAHAQSSKRARKTHCKRGHEFTPENTRTRKGSGERICVACRRAYDREYQRTRRAMRQGD